MWLETWLWTQGVDAVLSQAAGLSLPAGQHAAPAMGSAEKVQPLGMVGWAPGRSGTDAGQQGRESPLNAQLALGDVLHVCLVREELLQPLHEQQGLVVALDTVLSAVEHLVQGSRLHRVHSVAEDELLSGDALDAVQEPLLIQEEPLQPQAQALAGHHAGLV